jgi:uncharacterized membrane protein (DUF106 family)
MENPYELSMNKFLKIFGVFTVIIASIAMMIFAPMLLNSISDKPWTWWTYMFFIPLGITILIVVINIIDWDDLWDFDDINNTFKEYREEQKRQRKLAREKLQEKEINI